MKENIYSPGFVKNLFNSMSASYTLMNRITSFDFSTRWRKNCVNQFQCEDKVVLDLMTGMGECWPEITKNIGTKGQLIALDFSDEMIKNAEKNSLKFKQFEIKILKEDVFKNSIKDNSVDYIICAFGMKTLNENQLIQLFKEFDRILNSNGKFSIIEVSVPKNRLLQCLYLFYLKKIIPIFGAVFLGNPNDYKMLGIYTENFGNCEKILPLIPKSFETKYNSLFFGCATGISGIKTQ